ncbi:MAG: hypothetical protein IKN57_07230 [Parasporobacterium sp.]|nr:hypothetical protein [Parasporobacterium sp.]
MASLSYCRSELRSIIDEIRDIEWELRDTGNFAGVGQDLAADCVERIASKYDGVLRRLQNVNPNRLAEWILGG